MPEMNTQTSTKTIPTKRKGKVKRIMIWIFATIFALIAIPLCVLFVWSPGKIAPIPGVDGNPLPGSVSEIVRLTVGGVDQGMFLRGESDQNPVLLFLHGGPGSPEYMMEKKYPSGLEKEFTVCWWDQRGAGMSFNAGIPKESMTLSQMMTDTVEVTNYLRERFGKEKIYIMGHSWGSFLGMHVIAENPELYEAYIGIGQVADQVRSEQLAYSYMLENAKAARDSALIKKLQNYMINGPDDLTLEYMQVRTGGLNKQGLGVMHNMKSMFGDMILPMLRMPEYTFGQKIGYARGSLFALQTVWSAVASENLMETVTRVDIPVYIIQGKYDYQVSHDVAKEYSEKLTAPLVRFYSMENSAHSPCFEEPERFMQIIREDVLAR